MDLLAVLNQKVDRLIQRYEALKAENIQMRRVLQEKDQELETLRAQLAASASLVLATQIRSVVTSPALKEQSRQQIDAVISSIDKILTSLP